MTEQNQANKKGIKIVVNVVFYTVCVVLLSLMMYVLITVTTANKKGVLPSVFGYSLHYVVTDSMSPEIEVGELVWAKKTSHEQLVPMQDTVIFYNRSLGVYIVHKLREKKQDNSSPTGYSYVTYGVNPRLNSMDDDFHPTEISAVVVGHSMGLGKMVKVLKNPIYLALIVFVLLLLSFVPTAIKKIKQYMPDDIPKDNTTKEE